MVKEKNLKEEKKHFLIIILISFLYLAVFFIKPNVLNLKDNDLGRNYIPIFNFIKNSFLQTQSIPLWRSEQMIGESFIADPLSTVTYPFNLLLLVVPAIFFPVIYYLLHFIISGISTYLLARTFSISKNSALATAIIYTFSIKTLLHLGAGHITMVAAFCYFPVVFLSLRKVLDEGKTIWALALAISLSFILNLYATIFYYSVIFILIYITYYLISKPNVYKNVSKKIEVLKKCFIALISCIGFSAVFLIPQIEFSKFSSRTNLTINDVAIPLWNFKKFVLSIIAPYLIFKELDHESFLYLGVVPIILSVVGFLFLSKTKKVILLIVALLAFIFAAGLSTPIFKLFYEYLPLLKYSRVTTRFWFLIALIVALLSGFALDKIKQKKLAFVAVAFFLLETVFISYSKIKSTPNLNFENVNLYDYLAQDKDIFRVYCTTYCFNPQLSVKYDLKLLNGENPIQNTAYLNFLQKAGSYKFDRFAVIYPPYQIWQVPNPPQPDSDELGKANVKYVASTYDLVGKDFAYLGKFNNILLYENLKFKKRAYFQDLLSSTIIERSTPNNLTVTYQDLQQEKSLIVSDLYYPGWNAYSGGKKLALEDYDQIFMKVKVPQFSNKVELKFEPKSFLVGKAITFSTILFLVIYFWYKKEQPNG